MPCNERPRWRNANAMKAGTTSIWRFFERHEITFKKNPARRRAGSAGRRRAARLAGRPTRLGLDAAAAGVHRRDRRHDEDGSPPRALPTRPAAGRQGAARPLEDDHLHRRPAQRRSHCALGHRRRDGWPAFLAYVEQVLCRRSPRATSSSWTTCPPTRATVCAKDQGGRRNLLYSRPTPRPQSDRDGLRQTQGGAAQGRRAHRQGALEAHRQAVASPRPTRCSSAGWTSASTSRPRP